MLPYTHSGGANREHQEADQSRAGCSALPMPLSLPQNPVGSPHLEGEAVQRAINSHFPAVPGSRQHLAQAVTAHGVHSRVGALAPCEARQGPKGTERKKESLRPQALIKEIPRLYAHWHWVAYSGPRDRRQGMVG